MLTRVVLSCFSPRSPSERPHYTLGTRLQRGGGALHREGLHHQRGGDPGAHLSGDGPPPTPGETLQPLALLEAPSQGRWDAG